jgi:hypothetical protein
MPKWMMPHGDVMASLPPEMALIGAVLHQVLVDARSANPTIRADAHTFLNDPRKLAVWTDLVGIEPAAFQERVAALLRPPREA